MPEHIIIKNSVSELGIAPSDIIEYISPGEVTDVDYFKAVAAAELEKIKGLDVLSGYSVFPAYLEGKQLHTRHTAFNIGNDFSAILKSVEKIAIFACTVSGELNEVLEGSTQEDNFLENYILDIIGTVVIGKAAEKLHERIVSEYASFNVTNTLSPGNCGWPVEEQAKLLSLLPDGFLNIRLNDSGMMYPVKSLSGIIGIGERVRFKQTECRHCKSRNCPYRKEEYVGI